MIGEGSAFMNQSMIGELQLHPSHHEVKKESNVCAIFLARNQKNPKLIRRRNSLSIFILLRRMIFDFPKLVINPSIVRLALHRNLSLRTKSPSFNYCLELVEKNDYENFLCSLLLPVKLRHSAIVLRAFSTEVSMVEDQVSENVIGLMRFQFWEDTIDRLYDGIIPEHPICQELIKVIQTNQISKIYLQRLISSRRKFMKKQFKSLEEAEEHSDLSNSSLYLALLELNGIKNVDADHAASHLGKAQGLSIILRSVVRNAQKNTVLLPLEMLLKYGISQEDILRCKADVRAKDLAFELASSVHQHLEKVDKIRKKMKREIRCVFLPIVPIRCYLHKLRSADFNMFDPRLLQRDHWLTLKLFYRRLML